MCHPQCQSVLIFPMDQAIYSLVRCKTLNRIENRGRVIPVLSTYMHLHVHVSHNTVYPLWSHCLPALVGQSATADIGLPEPLLFYSVYSSSYTKDFAVTLPLILRSLAATSRPHHDVFVVCTITKKNKNKNKRNSQKN